MVNKFHKNSNCHLFSKTPEITYGKARRAPGRKVERHRNDGRRERVATVFLAPSVLELHAGNREITKAKGRNVS